MNGNSLPFTIEDIQTAHAKVKSGADFPQYVRELHVLGVASYRTWVSDGHADFVGVAGDASDALGKASGVLGVYSVSTPAKYAPLTIAPTLDEAFFRAELGAHQQGKTDYKSFCQAAAVSGIASWVTDIGAKTCSYYTADNAEVLVEAIPI